MTGDRRNRLRLIASSKGKFEQIAGFKCYVATPKGDYPKDKVILYMVDAFGLSLQNNLVCSVSLCSECLYRSLHFGV